MIHGLKSGSKVIYNGQECTIVFMTLNYLKVKIPSGEVIKITYNLIDTYEAKSN